ncbi:WxL domain-containing protein [Macrococcus bovicus]|uniref:WxL domain-containing protein n=1 Tax=Macrococcus bovicus TaxID=69968 RepID=A0A4R6C146_9STAP|nr:WxL domain-containing protein [Macrococcus bovicus]TDM14935.1 WxL domain-containing protein [Macrococcus bovicus]
MKTNKLLATSIAAGLLVTPFVTTNAHAETQSATSQARVEFNLPENEVTPQSPDGSGQTNNSIVSGDLEKGGTGTITNQTGSLTLDYVTHLDFGVHTIDTARHVYNTTTNQPYIQVSDRRGSGEGWNVTAELGRFNDGKADTLPGAAINLSNGAAKSSATTSQPIPEDNIELVSGQGAQPVVKAAAKTGEISTAEGLGTWTVDWLSSNPENEKVTLTVPEGAASPGTHTATITWTLGATPE